MLVYARQNIRIRRLIYLCLRFSGLPFIFRETLQKNRVTILFFHEIDPKNAEKTFRYLVNNYQIISLNEFFDLYRRKERFPKKSLVITFDDGHKSNYDLLPIFKKYGVPITIFLCSGIANTNRHFWFKEAQSNEAYLPLTTEQLKKVSNNKRLQILKKIGFENEKGYDTPHALSKKQIYEMLPYVNFQSHTLFHPCLTQCNTDEAYDEIFASKRILEKEYGLIINAIAYPNGDYSDREVQLCMAAGYDFGLTVDFGFNTHDTHPLKLKRIHAGDKFDNLDEFIVYASGFAGFLYAAICRIRAFRKQIIK